MFNCNAKEDEFMKQIYMYEYFNSFTIFDMQRSLQSTLAKVDKKLIVMVCHFLI